MCPTDYEDPGVVWFIQWLVPIALPAAAGFVGVLIGAWLTSQREQRQRQLAFLEKQLSGFYSPILGLRKEIHAQSALRTRIHDAARVTWEQLVASGAEPGREGEFANLIEYDNEKFTKDLLPLYREMLSVFRSSYWLARPETRLYYETLVEFVEVWNRWLAKSLPAEVVQQLEHGEEKLQPFYQHIEQTHDSIRATLEAGGPGRQSSRP
jgi:hypothetical protein